METGVLAHAIGVHPTAVNQWSRLQGKLTYGPDKWRSRTYTLQSVKAFLAQWLTTPHGAQAIAKRIADLRYEQANPPPPRVTRAQQRAEEYRLRKVSTISAAQVEQDADTRGVKGDSKKYW